MAKKINGIKNFMRIALIITICIILFVIAYFYYTFYISPQDTTHFYRSAITKIGAPKGFTINPSREEVQSNPIENISVRRAYDGNGNLAQVQKEMLQRVRNAGFENALIQNNNIFATCKGTGVYVRIYQLKDDPIDIEIYQANYPNSPNCPSF